MLRRFYNITYCEDFEVSLLADFRYAITEFDYVAVHPGE
jgi:hypothetical protein